MRARTSAVAVGADQVTPDRAPIQLTAIRPHEVTIAARPAPARRDLAAGLRDQARIALVAATIALDHHAPARTMARDLPATAAVTTARVLPREVGRRTIARGEPAAMEAIQARAGHLAGAAMAAAGRMAIRAGARVALPVAALAVGRALHPVVPALGAAAAAIKIETALPAAGVVTAAEIPAAVTAAAGAVADARLNYNNSAWQNPFPESSGKGFCLSGRTGARKITCCFASRLPIIHHDTGLRSTFVRHSNLVSRSPHA